MEDYHFIQKIFVRGIVYVNWQIFFTSSFFLDNLRDAKLSKSTPRIHYSKQKIMRIATKDKTATYYMEFEDATHCTYV
jgi:hypothetical protein